MSRSRKKPFVNDYSKNYTRWAKRQASKKVRRTKNIPNGKHYKKVFNSYDIFDYKYLMTGYDFYNYYRDDEDSKLYGNIIIPMYRWYIK